MTKTTKFELEGVQEDVPVLVLDTTYLFPEDLELLSPDALRAITDQVGEALVARNIDPRTVLLSGPDSLEHAIADDTGIDPLDLLYDDTIESIGDEDFEVYLGRLASSSALAKERRTSGEETQYTNTMHTVDSLAAYTDVDYGRTDELLREEASGKLYVYDAAALGLERSVPFTPADISGVSVRYTQSELAAAHVLTIKLNQESIFSHPTMTAEKALEIHDTLLVDIASLSDQVAQYDQRIAESSTEAGRRSFVLLRHRAEGDLRRRKVALENTENDDSYQALMASREEV